LYITPEVLFKNFCYHIWNYFSGCKNYFAFCFLFWSSWWNVCKIIII